MVSKEPTTELLRPGLKRMLDTAGAHVRLQLAVYVHIVVPT